MSEKSKEELKRFLKGILGDTVVLALSVVYTLTAFLTLSATGKSALQVIADGVVAFLMGFFLNREFEYKGMCQGDTDASVRSTVDKHSQAVEMAVPYISELDMWCDCQNKRAMRRARERILAEGCMRYGDYFDDDGMSVEFVPDREKLKSRYMRKIETARIRTYYKALTVHLTPLTANVLISESARSSDPFYFGRSKFEYSKQSSRKDAFTKIILAVLFGYYGVTLIGNFSVASLIWKLFQVVTFLMMGTIKKDRAVSYMLGEYKDRITQKTVHLQMFMSTVQHGILENKTEEK